MNNKRCWYLEEFYTKNNNLKKLKKYALRPSKANAGVDINFQVRKHFCRDSTLFTINIIVLFKINLKRRGKS